MGGLGRFPWKKQHRSSQLLTKNSLMVGWRVQCTKQERSIGKGWGDEMQLWLPFWGKQQSPCTHVRIGYLFFVMMTYLIFIFLQGWVVQKTSSRVQMVDVYHGPRLAMGKRIVKMAQMNHHSAEFSRVLNKLDLVFVGKNNKQNTQQISTQSLHDLLLWTGS